MVEKLRLIINRPGLLLLPKIVGFIAFLWVINLTKSWWLVFCFFVFSYWLYNKYLKGGVDSRFFSFWFLWAMSLFVSFNIGQGIYSWIIFIFLGALLYMLIGSRAYFFLHHKTFGSIFYYFLVFVFLSVEAYLFGVSDVFTNSLIVFLFLYLSVKEYMSFMLAEKIDGRKRIFALVFGLIGGQLFFVSQFLSIGFLNTASLLLVFLIIALDTSIHFFEGELNRKIIKRNVLFFVSFVVLILLLPSLLS